MFVASLIEVARGAFRVVLLRGIIPEERHQAVPESLQHMHDKADHGLRHFIEAGVDQVRQFPRPVSKRCPSSRRDLRT
jgi:hypothetical protein